MQGATSYYVKVLIDEENELICYWGEFATLKEATDIVERYSSHQDWKNYKYKIIKRTIIEEEIE